VLVVASPEETLLERLNALRSMTEYPTVQMRERSQAKGMQVPPIELRTWARWHLVKDNPDLTLPHPVPVHFRKASTFSANEGPVLHKYISHIEKWRGIIQVLTPSYKQSCSTTRVRIQHVLTTPSSDNTPHFYLTSCPPVEMGWHAIHTHHSRFQK